MKPPLRITLYSGESYGIHDSRGVTICYVYFDDDEKRRLVRKRMTKAEAENVAKHIAQSLADKAV